MKKIIILSVALVCLAVIGSALTASAATYSYTGTTSIGPPGSTTTVSTSNNVYCKYMGVAQLYAAGCHNKAGDKTYATGGGGSNASGIYYKTDATWIGNPAADPGGSITSSTFTGTDWTAQ